MSSSNNRRAFLRQMGMYTLGMGMLPAVLAACGGATTGSKDGKDSAAAGLAGAEAAKEMFFKISLAEWSFHQALFAGKMDHLDFALRAKNEFDIHAVEYVNQFFKDKAKDKTYLGEMKKRADDNGVKSVLIMCDGEGDMGDQDAKKRLQAVENHYKWVEAAAFLGCHAIRVNAAGEGKPEEVAKRVADSLTKLATFGKDQNIEVIVENHGGISSNGEWLSGIMKTVNMPTCGTLPDFGNFCIKHTAPENNTPEAWAKIKCLDEYDRYKGIQELMPFAKGVSAKSHDFDANGNETQSDFKKIMQIVKDAGYKGYVGIEYEGVVLSEEEGVKKTKDLLLKVGQELS